MGGDMGNSNGNGLSRKQGLQRKTPLKSNGGLRQGAPLKRTPMKRTPPPKNGSRPRKKRSSQLKNKPPEVTEAEKRCREIVAERSDGLCECCGEAGGLDKAHRVARSQGGKWDPANILDLCRMCHSGNHNSPQRAYDHGWHLRSHQDPVGEPALLWKSGVKDWAYLDSEGGWRWA